MTLIIDRNLTLPDLPEVPDSLPMYRVTRTRSLSRGDAEVRRQIERKVERWSGVFPVDAERADLGDRILYLDDDAALEVFVPSDSVWWSDRTTAFAERPPEDPLPEPDEAAELAKRLVEELDVAGDELRLRDVSPVNAGSSASPKDDAGREPVATGVTVSFGYALGDLPVVGPGARIRVSYTGGGKLAEFARFWREPELAGEVRTVHPLRAVDRFASDGRFADVDKGGLSVEVDDFRLALYAAGPSAFQRFLVPVYEVRGRVRGGELEQDVFDVYVAAVDIGEADLKRSMVRDRPVFRPVFTGF